MGQPLNTFFTGSLDGKTNPVGFRRADDGSVEVVAGREYEGYPVIARIDPASWASTVASVSSTGDTADTFVRANALHMGEASTDAG